MFKEVIPTIHDSAPVEVVPSLCPHHASLQWLNLIPRECLTGLSFFTRDLPHAVSAASPWAHELSALFVRVMHSMRMAWPNSPLPPLVSEVFGPLLALKSLGLELRFDINTRRYSIKKVGLRQPYLAQLDLELNPYYVNIQTMEEYLRDFEANRGTEKDRRFCAGVVACPTCEGPVCYGYCGSTISPMPTIQTVADLSVAALPLTTPEILPVGVPEEGVPLGHASPYDATILLDAVPRQAELVLPDLEDLLEDRNAPCPVACAHQPAPLHELVDVPPELAQATASDEALVAPFSLPISIFEKPRVLDLGAGDGSRAGALRRYFPEAEIVDIDPDPFSTCSFPATSANDIVGQFDVIILNQVLHHVRTPKPPDWYGAIRRLLAPRGVVVVREDVWDGTLSHWLHLDAKHVKYKDCMSPAHFLSPRLLLQGFMSAGLVAVTEIPAVDRLVFRANGYEGQVYIFVGDDGGNWTHHYAVSSHLKSQYTWLKHVLRASPLKEALIISKIKNNFPKPIAYYLRGKSEVLRVSLQHATRLSHQQFHAQAFTGNSLAGPDNVSRSRVFERALIRAYMEVVRLYPAVTVTVLAARIYRQWRPYWSDSLMQSFEGAMDKLLANDVLILKNSSLRPGVNWFMESSRYNEY